MVAEKGKGGTKVNFICFPILSSLLRICTGKSMSVGEGESLTPIFASIANSSQGFPPETLFTWLTHTVISNLPIVK